MIKLQLTEKSIFSESLINISKLSLYILLSLCTPLLAISQNFSITGKSVAWDRDVNDKFGNSVSISGNYAVVGAYRAEHPVFGSLVQSGAAYIYEKNSSGNWAQIQKIQPQSPSDQERDFGWAVSISGNYIIVGCPGALKDANGLNQIAGGGNLGVGAAFIFKRNTNGVWEEVQKLVASDRASSDQFGLAVDISGTKAIIGACWEDEDEFGGNTKDYAGSAYIFECSNNGNWNEVQKIVSSDRDVHNKFGWSVSIEQNYAIVGAIWENSNIANNGFGGHEGAVYVYKRQNSGYWNEIQKVKHSDVEWMDHFGYSVSLSGNYFVAGAPKNPNDNLGLNHISEAGAAYIFKKNNFGTFDQTQKIVASDRSLEDSFGEQVDISGNNIIIGVPQEDHNSNGGNYMSTAGSIYIFNKNISGNWSQTHKEVAFDRSTGDGFGWGLAISSTDIIIGAPSEDHDVSGGNYMKNAGSVYILGECFHTNNTINETSCNSYTSPSGIVYSNSGTYTDIIDNSTGCDSIITINLIINNPSSSIINKAACNSYTSPSGVVYSNSGTYTDVITNSIGCDSIITINLTINTETSSTINEAACNSYTSPSGVVYSNSGTYTDIITNSIGCDSIITINLTINTETNSTINETACNSYTSPSGNLYTSSGTYNDIINNSAGCDSIITINLTINTETNSTINETACNSYTSPSGIVYTNSGTYIDIINNSTGCDSIITINLTINTETNSTINETACNSYTSPSGNLYTSSGIYNDIIPNTAGCDSVITINLIIDPFASLNVSANNTNMISCYGLNDGEATVITNTGTAPFNYVWNTSPVQITATATGLEAGTYWVTVTDNNGCLDSTSITISEPLLLLATTTSTDLLCYSDCNGEININPTGGTPPYQFSIDNGTSFQSSSFFNNLCVNNYDVIVKDANGCETNILSTIVNAPPQLNLNFNVINESCVGSEDGTINSIVNGGTGTYTYDWTPQNGTTAQLSNLTAGNYSLTVTDSNGCSVTSNVTITANPLPNADAGSDGIICIGEDYILDASGGDTYLWLHSGDTTQSIVVSPLNDQWYTVEVTNSFGCKSIDSAFIQVVLPGNTLALDDTGSVENNTSIQINAGQNDIGDLSTLTIIINSSHGTCSVGANGIINYQPDADFTGTDTITYIICDEYCNNSCDTALIIIKVIQEIPLDIPNGYSPNSDGINDAFVIIGIDKYPDNELIIFNRWGDMVFQAKPYYNNWEGKCNNNYMKLGGDKLVDGTYFYYLKLNDITPEFSGFVELKRN